MSLHRMLAPGERPARFYAPDDVVAIAAGTYCATRGDAAAAARAVAAVARTLGAIDDDHYRIVLARIDRDAERQTGGADRVFSLRIARRRMITALNDHNVTADARWALRDGALTYERN